MATVIQLDPALDEAVQELLRGGDYESPIDVLRDAIGLLQLRQRRKELHAAIEEGIAQADAGQLIPIEQVRAEMLGALRQLARSALKVGLTPRARRGLDSIGDWIAKDDPRRAATFVDELIEKAMQIGETPLAFPVVPKLASAGVRHRVHGRYLILYRIRAGRVEILHVLHGAPDYHSLLELGPDGD